MGTGARRQEGLCKVTRPATLIELSNIASRTGLGEHGAEAPRTALRRIT
jgi:hypothetical protein